MSSDTDKVLYLLLYRGSSTQRAHFALFVPNSTSPSRCPNKDACVGTKIHVVGTPMNGYAHEIIYNYDTSADKTFREAIELGHIASDLVPDPTDEALVKTDKAHGRLAALALQVQPPRPSANFMGPVDGVNNRRCQEWTMAYVQCLVQKAVLSELAIDRTQAKRDPSDFGIGLRNVAAGGGARGGTGSS